MFQLAKPVPGLLDTVRKGKQPDDDIIKICPRGRHCGNTDMVVPLYFSDALEVGRGKVNAILVGDEDARVANLGQPEVLVNVE